MQDALPGQAADPCWARGPCTALEAQRARGADRVQKIARPCSGAWTICSSCSAARLSQSLLPLSMPVPYRISAQAACSRFMITSRNKAG